MNRENKVELYKIIREQIAHENDLVNQRLNWILFSQSFLFAAFFTIWTVSFNQISKNAIIMNFFIPMMGAFLSWFGIKSIIDAFNAIRGLRQFWFFKTGDEGDWEKNNHSDDSDDEIYKTKELPDISYKGKGELKPRIFKIKNFSAENAAINIPLAIIIGWAMLFMSNCIFYFSAFSYTKDIEIKIPKESKFVFIQGTDTTKLQQLSKEQEAIKKRLDSLTFGKK